MHSITVRVLRFCMQTSICSRLRSSYGSSPCSRLYDVYRVRRHSVLGRWHISSRNMQDSIYTFKLLHFKYPSTVSEFCCSCMNSVCPQCKCVLYKADAEDRHEVFVRCFSEAIFGRFNGTSLTDKILIKSR